MKFQSLKVKNFSSYNGQSEAINLATTEAKPLIIFVGGNGFGKTSLFDAINWALYGTDYEKDLEEKKDRGIIDYINESALKEGLLKGQRVEMSVTLYFEHTDNYAPFYTNEYYVTQSLIVEVKSHNDGKGFNVDLVARTTNLFHITPSNDHEEIKYNRTFLDEILPNNVKSYFLFDGDRIHNLAKPGNSMEVRDAIYRVVDLEIIRNAVDHLNEVSIEYSRKAGRNLTGDLAEIEKKYEQELKFQDGVKLRMHEIKFERKAIQDQCEIIDAKLKDYPQTQSHQERRTQLEKEISTNSSKKKQAKQLVREAAAKASFGLINSQIKELRLLLHGKRVKGEIPKHIRETFFEDLFQMKQCICGTGFDTVETDKIYVRLKSRLETEKTSSHEEDQLIDLLFGLEKVEEAIKESKIRLDESDKVVFDLESEERNLIMEKSEIDKLLLSQPVEDISKLVIQRNEKEKRDKELLEELINKEKALENSNGEMQKLEEQREKFAKHNKEISALHFRKNLSKRAADKLSDLYEEFAETSRADVERLTQDEFKKFVSSSSGYQVKLNNNYALEVIDSNGNNALQRLSMGQSQCLSLAFITAISRVSEKYPPLIIDMPFSRLDHSVHDSVSQRLPQISKQTILFLLSDTEWNPITRNNLSRFANNMYEMSFDPEVRQTTISKMN